MKTHKVIPVRRGGSLAFGSCVLAVFLAAILCGLPRTARGQVTYAYTGNSFSYVGTGPDVTHVSGSFTLASAIPANTTVLLSPYTAGGTITDYSFTDGRYTTDIGNYATTNPLAEGPFTFVVTTDGNGNIANWDLGIISSDAWINTWDVSSWSQTGYDDLYDTGNQPASDGVVADTSQPYDAYNFNTPGTWTVTGSRVPEPGTDAILVLGGFIGLAGLRRKLSRKTMESLGHSTVVSLVVHRVAPVAVLLAALAVQSAFGQIVSDGGFDSLDINGNFEYNPSGTPWTFTGGTGIAENNIGFGYNSFDVIDAPTNWVGFIQGGDGTIGSTTINQLLTLDAGTYDLSVLSEGRYTYAANPVTVDIFDATLTNNYMAFDFTPTSLVEFDTYSDSFTVPADGQYYLYFVGDGITGDDTTFVDNVEVTPATVPEPSTWAAMLCGIGMLGCVLRFRCRGRS